MNRAWDALAVSTREGVNMKSVIHRDREPLPCPSTCAGWWVIYKVYHAPEDDHVDQF